MKCMRGFFSCQIYGFDYHKNTRATSFILVVHRVVDYLTLRIISFIYMPIIIINMREWICGYGIILQYFFNVVSFTSYPTKAPHFSYGWFYSHSQQMVCRYACVRVFNVQNRVFMPLIQYCFAASLFIRINNWLEHLVSSFLIRLIQLVPLPLSLAHSLTLFLFYFFLFLFAAFIFTKQTHAHTNARAHTKQRKQNTNR